jgi:hypothetical protein
MTGIIKKQTSQNRLGEKWVWIGKINCYKMFLFTVVWYFTRLNHSWTKVCLSYGAGWSRMCAGWRLHPQVLQICDANVTPKRCQIAPAGQSNRNGSLDRIADFQRAYVPSHCSSLFATKLRTITFCNNMFEWNENHYSIAVRFSIVTSDKDGVRVT